MKTKEELNVTRINISISAEEAKFILNALYVTKLLENRHDSNVLGEQNEPTMLKLETALAGVFETTNEKVGENMKILAQAFVDVILILG
jgi:hypothetical protein